MFTKATAAFWRMILPITLDKEASLPLHIASLVSPQYPIIIISFFLSMSAGVIRQEFCGEGQNTKVKLLKLYYIFRYSKFKAKYSQ